MATKQPARPVKKTKKQIALQRQLTVLAVVVVIFAVIFGAGALWGHGLGGSAKPETIAQTLTTTGDMVKVSYEYTSAVRYTDQSTAFYGWEAAASRTNFTILYSGSMVVGSDTTGLTKDNVKIEGKKVTVTVPAIALRSHTIDPDSISVYDEDNSAFQPIELTDLEGFMADRKDADVQEATNRNVFSDAQTRLTQVIQTVVKAMGDFETVEVVFA